MSEPRGRKPKYLTLERFNEFLNGDFWHLKVKVNIILWVTLSILAAIIASWAMR